MDPGTVLGIVSLALEVSKLMYKTAEGIGSAGEDVRLLADQVDSFVKAAKAVHQALESPPPPRTMTSLRAKIGASITDIIENCGRALHPLKKLLAIFEPLVLAQFTTTTTTTTTPWPRQQPSTGRLKPLGYMIRFYLKRDDVQKYCQALHASSQSLSLCLSTLIFLQTLDASTSRLQIAQI